MPLSARGGGQEMGEMGAFSYHSPQEKRGRQKDFYTHNQQGETKTQACKFHEDVAYLSAVE